MKRVVVNIERLVLKGFRFEARHAIAQGLQEQLSLLLAEPGMPERLASLGKVPRLRTKPISLPGEANPRQVGQDAANGIGEGLGR